MSKKQREMCLPPDLNKPLVISTAPSVVVTQAATVQWRQERRHQLRNPSSQPSDDARTAPPTLSQNFEMSHLQNGQRLKNIIRPNDPIWPSKPASFAPVAKGIRPSSFRIGIAGVLVAAIGSALLLNQSSGAPPTDAGPKLIPSEYERT
mmetsp:Transcript_54331/g.74241  ORF Transcript_54331/g.74241 Transcript_54331/m.74241 type:complete len:149 (-) Transcript_54331:471-917(-)|eukprot:CAMPEP_0185770858 /NCGR_PEP_ID=MMETSP1174-20130828/61544_1 /TAXON_ID=35687 /ORGANISM="Dictyocha speculum, Strain CCMP1381" /LENGTH=148 /DNA_ID=CAMNT_0028456473 /DNA_START=41 /DNA_END=487 /DNA_ORIENTATION=+